ncbi:YchJ family protein [Flavicella sediminum]|uniref:YchJ family protein n=1 Tax=Flavicella sediminum TaxID=2585141 RepID=UPI00111FEB09|nr:YchJ family metal-binding protein [Flavicella sediminum]
MEEEICPCGTGKAYKICCGAIHKGKVKAQTAEELMRSRYSAFTKADGDYLMRSYHSSTKPLSEKKEIVRWAKSVTWLSLLIVAKTKGTVNDTEGTVEFKASFLENGEVKVIYENSYFSKEKGHWVYEREN